MIIQAFLPENEIWQKVFSLDIDQIDYFQERVAEMKE